MVELIFIEDDAVLSRQEGLIRRIYDPTIGTAGMLSGADDYLRECNYGVHPSCPGRN